ncbi:hypothetical protein Zmor_003313 [Zophobas morio]|uniref:Lipase n=1 Tax=Zophobas morio TaxID=2755281 RepID=A0AA38HNM5_9CUCU|nr:hypothetical protein Zmor_003313 [Zophobas morio]
MSLLPATLVILATFHHGLSSVVPFDASDVGLNTVQMIENHGYPCESHTITTEDGYILVYHRILHGKNDDGSVQKPPVLLMHGTFSSSADYVSMGPDRSLAYLLADIGYDVWIGNARGNEWSRNHTTLDVVKDAEEYFDFSWHEIGYYDLPAAIDHILSVNGGDGLHYVGHSQGTTVFMVLTTTRPEYSDKIKLASLMGPPAAMTHQSNPIILELAKYIFEIEALFKKYKFYELTYVKEIREFAASYCAQPGSFEICEGIIFEFIGADAPQLDINIVPVLFSNMPTNSAWKQLFHYLQEIKSGEFCQYDHGSEKNLEIYGSARPPVYDLSKISTPVAAYYGKNDVLVNYTDVQIFISDLPTVANDYLVPFDLFNHFDFMYATDVVDLLYVELIKVMQQY